MTTDHPSQGNFGQLDGEAIDGLALRLTGTGGLTEVPTDGLELILIATVVVSPGVKIKRDEAGRLLREHSAKVARLSIAPEGSTVADDAMAFLSGYQAALDTLRGVDRLPLDAEEEELEEAEEEDPNAD